MDQTANSIVVSFLPEGAAVTVPGFSLADTLDCGQCFRWEALAEENGPYPDNRLPAKSYRGIVLDKTLTVSQQGDGLLLHGVTEKDYPFWSRYFDLDTDYAAMAAVFRQDPTLLKACRAAGGIRLLRQDPWEALCCFIISQNNNIPRIRGIVARLCEQFGERMDGGFSFPRPEALAGRTAEELAPLRAGFRAKYILDAAEKAATGALPLEAIGTMPIEDARTALMTIHGVGPKVAECALLYGFHRLEAFPVDTWIKKALTRYYPDGFPAFAEPRGVAQQFLFHYIRTAART